ncbi:hypothetical protein [Psychromonas sp.]|uniref:hypothetical protein n=1 Tax=Psychromonas sp. TaxID=1884585 RepID=UPI0039E5103E
MKVMLLHSIKFSLLILILVLGGCQKSKTTVVDGQLDDPVVVVVDVPLDSRILPSAASFLAAASGKENEITVDNLVFVNSVLGINKVQGTPKGLYGDLWVLLRDEYGLPILDENGCEQPIASEPIAVLDDQDAPVLDAEENPIFTNIVPMVAGECEVDPEFEGYTMEVEIGRMNVVRSSANNPDVLARSLAEAIKNINAADSISLDLSGRLVLTSNTDILDELTGLTTTLSEDHTIDSPLENLALYMALITEGRIAGYGIEATGEEGEIIPAPWLEIRSDLPMGDLTYLRDGTLGRDKGIDLYNNYADFSTVIHNSKKRYHKTSIDFVQYNLDYDAEDMNSPVYFDDTADIWERVLDSESFSGTNIVAFAKLADDARKVITFMHNIIQDLPVENTIVSLPAVADFTPSGDGDPLNDPRVLDSAASFLAAAMSKEVPLTVDAVIFVNNVLGINELGDIAQVDLFGDLWILHRDENGVPLLDLNNCVKPVASEDILVVDEDGNPVLDGDNFTYTDIVPMVVEEYMDGLSKCAVEAGYEEYVQEVELGRLNLVRTAMTNPNVLNRQLVEAINDLNTATMLKRDLGGRLIYSVPVKDEDGVDITMDKTIDSPLQNLALYGALMKWGSLEGTVTIKGEGEEEEVNIVISDTLNIDDQGLGYLKRGGVFGNNGIRLKNGYADFGGYGHNTQGEYEGLYVDYVQWHDSSEADFSFTYTDETQYIWDRVLKDSDTSGDGEDGKDINTSNLAAFTEHADDARKVIVFTHNIIQDMPE